MAAGKKAAPKRSHKNRFSAMVVGAGGISNAWFPRLLAEKVEIRGVVDLSREAAEGKIAQYDLPADAGTDLKAMIKKTAPDFVVDLTIPDAHCKVTCAALAAGCHVIGEKPMANSMAEARKMVRAAEKAGKLYMVSQSRRYEGVHENLRKALTGGKLGNLTTANCDFYIGAHFGGFRDVMESPLILDMSIHHFDLIRMMTGADPVAVYAHEFNPKGSWYKGDVAASCIFEMSNGIVFTYRGSWCAEGCNTSWHGDWRFIGDKGSLIYDGGEGIRGEVVKKANGFFSEMKALKVNTKTPKYQGQHGAIRELLQYLKDGTPPQGECHDNIKSLAMVFAAMESARKGRRIPVKVM
ncbi:MAG: Gfo/Idh/MocA family protein [Planctomycetota bacterium]|jgi:predicted dehydrogenase